MVIFGLVFIPIENARTIIKVELGEEELIEFNSFGFIAKKKKVKESDLQIEYSKGDTRNKRKVVRVLNKNKKFLYYYYPDLFDKEELLNSESSFLQELGKI